MIDLLVVRRLSTSVRAEVRDHLTSFRVTTFPTTMPDDNVLVHSRGGLSTRLESLMVRVGSEILDYEIIDLRRDTLIRLLKYARPLYEDLVEMYVDGSLRQGSDAAFHSMSDREIIEDFEFYGNTMRRDDPFDVYAWAAAKYFDVALGEVTDDMLNRVAREVEMSSRVYDDKEES